MIAQEQITALHPIMTGRHDLFDQAMKLVTERTGKFDLVELVNALLAIADNADRAAREECAGICAESKRGYIGMRSNIRAEVAGDCEQAIRETMK
jgi:hypothetical protein